MTASTILTMSNGRGIDLLDPKPQDISWASVAEHLAKEKRYNGATPDVEYSVAQHSFLGAEAILADGFTEREAAYFLLHDAHEAFIKDLTTPLKQAVASIAEDHYAAIPADILNSFDALEQRVDRAIYEAAGLQWPAPKVIRALVKRYDLIMFVTEWRDLMPGIAHPNWAPYSGIKPLPQTIEPLRWPQSRAGWLLRAHRLLPAMKVSA